MKSIGLIIGAAVAITLGTVGAIGVVIFMQKSVKVETLNSEPIHQLKTQSSTPFTRVTNSSSSDDILQRLKEGNKRFVSGTLSFKDFSGERAELATLQQPYAIVLACSDSRVPPELIFDESVGRLFVVRIAGNIVTAEILGSIEFAAEHLQAKTLVILGHENCDILKASHSKSKTSPNFMSILTEIKASHIGAQSSASETETNQSAVEQNIKHQIERVSNMSESLKTLIEKSEFEVFGAIYGLADGRVRWLKPEKQKIFAQPHSTTQLSKTRGDNPHGLSSAAHED